MITPVEAKLNDTNGIVVLESDLLDPNAFEELRNAAAMEMAIKYANTKGLPDPRISGTVDVYAVDKDGAVVSIEEPKPIAAFRADVPVTRKLL